MHRLFSKGRGQTSFLKVRQKKKSDKSVGAQSVLTKDMVETDEKLSPSPRLRLLVPTCVLAVHPLNILQSHPFFTSLCHCPRTLSTTSHRTLPWPPFCLWTSPFVQLHLLWTWWPDPIASHWCSECLNGIPWHLCKSLTVTWGPHGLAFPNSSTSLMPAPITHFISATWANHLPDSRHQMCIPSAWITLSPSLYPIIPSHPSYFDLKMTSYGKVLSLNTTTSSTWPRLWKNAFN